MIDSGGIQEESFSIGKPVLILRENTERVEGIKSGSAFLTGTFTNSIYYFASLLLKNETLYKQMAKPNHIYGNGNASKIIFDLIEHYFEDELSNSYYNNSNKLNNLNYIKILSQYDNSIINSDNDLQYDLVIVLLFGKEIILKISLC